jgi:hypothetical protein
MHPFTCGNGGHDHGVLIAKEDGWHCEKCEYTQNWAHGFMADWGWMNIRKSISIPGISEDTNEIPIP